MATTHFAGIKNGAPYWKIDSRKKGPKLTRCKGQTKRAHRAQVAKAKRCNTVKSRSH